MKFVKFYIGAVFVICYNFVFAQLPVCSNPLVPNLGSGTGIDSVYITNYGNSFGHGTPIEEGYTNEIDSPGVDSCIIIQRGERAQLRISAMTCPSAGLFNLAYMRVWVDWNEDGDFTDPGDTVANTVALTFGAPAPGTGWANFTPPVSTTLGKKRMRIMVDSCGTNVPTNPCIAPRSGDVEDYIICLVDQSQALDTVLVTQGGSKSCFDPNDSLNYVLGLQFNTSFGLNLMDIQSMTFNISGSNNISGLELWYGGTTPTAGLVSLISSTNTITPTTILNFSQTLTNDKEHYFYVVAVVSPGAIANSTWDIGVASIGIDTGSVYTYNITNGNPLGTFRICGPELCDNGIDDDNDGFVDCFDNECFGVAPCGSSDTSFFGIETCLPRGSVIPSAFNTQLKWQSGVIMSPPGSFVIGDIDQDCVPEIIVPENANDNIAANKTPNIFILDGETGVLENTFVFPGGAVIGQGNIAVGDVDGDGFGEIFARGDNPVGLACFEHDGTIKWGPIAGGGNHQRGINIADFNLDGNLELYIGNMIYDANTGALLINGGAVHSGAGRWGYAFPVAVDILPDAFCNNCTGLELVVGDQVLSVDLANGAFNIEAVSPAPNSIPFFFPKDGYTSVADINNDGRLDVIVTINNAGTSFLYAWDPFTGDSIAPTITSATPMGRTCIGNFDADPELEIAYTNQLNIRVVNHDFSLKWAAGGLNEANGVLTPVAMDLDGDGTKEIIIRDQARLKIYNATTGALKRNIACGSSTGIENAVIADVNNDGQAEVACICSPTTFPGPGYQNARMRLYGSSNEPWVPTRKVWNQASYFVTNVNDNLSISQTQDHSKIPALNSFLVQTPLLDASGILYYGSTDELDIALTITDIIVPSVCDTMSTDDTVLVVVEYCNLSVDCDDVGNIPTTVYLGDPHAGGSKIYQGVYLDSIQKNTCVLDTIKISMVTNATIYVYVNDLGNNPASAPDKPFLECDTINNSDFAPVILETTIIASAQVSPVNTICLGESVNLQGSGGAIYDWQPGNSLNQQQQNPIATPWETTTYKLRVTNSSGSCESWDSVTVFVDSPEIFDLGIDTQVCGENEMQLMAPAGFGNYLWSTGETSNSITVKMIDTYYLTVLKGVCTSIDSVNVSFCIGMYVPNAFSPNDDGENDYFKIRSEGVNSALLKIYNRWGDLVYETTDPVNDSWDGFINSKRANAGVYVYRLTGIYVDESPIDLKGNITLVR